MRWYGAMAMVMVLAALTGCQLVAGTGDKASDPAAAERFVPQNIPGYTSSDAISVSDALSKAGASVSLLSGNVTLAAVVAKLDTMIQCYKNVGAVAARVYTEQNLPTAGIPKIGALAVVNITRIQSNFVQCALNVGQASAQGVGEIQPCGGSGDKVVNNEKLQYVFGATTPELCTIFQAQFN